MILELVVVVAAMVLLALALGHSFDDGECPRCRTDQFMQRLNVEGAPRYHCHFCNSSWTKGESSHV